MSSTIHRSTGYVSQTRRILVIKAVAISAFFLILVSEVPWAHNSFAAMALQSTGLCLIMTAILGRVWATLYIGGRKNACLITTGPYSITRNPLYCFSIIGAAGVGLVFSSLVLAFILGGAIALILRATARSEATFLEQRFGASYDAYAARVPLLWPRPSLYQEKDGQPFQPHAIRRTLRDGLLFLLAAPAAELVIYAKQAGLLPQLIPLF